MPGQNWNRSKGDQICSSHWCYDKYGWYCPLRSSRGNFYHPIKRIALFIGKNNCNQVMYTLSTTIDILFPMGLTTTLLCFMYSITCTISCIGAAGLPNGGYVMLVMVLNSVGVPAEDVMLIVAIDCLV